jgi:hypothetical protein
VVEGSGLLNRRTPKVYRKFESSRLRQNTRTGGREAQCKGLQIPKTVGSNPTRCSIQCLASVNGSTTVSKTASGGSNPSRDAIQQ